MTTAGSSATPLPRKLGIRAGSRVLLAGAPANLPALLGELPDGVELVAAGEREVDVAVLFVKELAALHEQLGALARLLAPAGGLWVAWPKRASGVATDVGEGAVRELGLATGLVDNKICAIDATWSGLRFVRRLRDRPPAARRRGVSG
jgi:hypothetical protein